MAAVDIADLNVTYAGVDRSVSALRSLTLSVADGEPIAIIGPSGCGKSTLLLGIAGLVAPDSGTLTVGGAPVTGPRLRTALILQDFGLLPWKTVFHNAALGLELRRVDVQERTQTVVDALERLGLAEFARAYPGELSGGMRQRLALARALALDALTREDLQNLLLVMWRQRGHTAILVTHSIEEAVYLGRRIVVLSPRPGRVAGIVDNPGMDEDGYRDTPAFLERTSELRRLLEAEGAIGAAAGGMTAAGVAGVPA